MYPQNTFLPPDGSLKREQNRLESAKIDTYTFWDAFLGGSGYLLVCDFNAKFLSQSWSLSGYKYGNIYIYLLSINHYIS